MFNSINIAINWLNKILEPKQEEIVSKYRKYTDDDIDFILDNHDLSSKALAFYLGRTDNAIRMKRMMMRRKGMIK